MDPIRSAIYRRLHGDTLLTALLAAPDAICHRRAKQGARPPYVVLQEQSNVPVWTLGTARLDNALWMVKAVDLNHSAARAEDIRDRTEELLHDAPLSIPDMSLLWLRRESSMNYGESDGADEWQHVGHLYRIVTAT